MASAKRKAEGTAEAEATVQVRGPESGSGWGRTQARALPGCSRREGSGAAGQARPQIPQPVASLGTPLFDCLPAHTYCNSAFTLTPAHPQILPLGAGQEVGRSCIIVRYAGKTVMLDCGVHPGFFGLASLPFFDEVDLAEVDVMLVTHFHLDHCAAVPYVTGHTPFRGRVLMTHATKAIVHTLLKDFVKVSKGGTGVCVYGWAGERGRRGSVARLGLRRAHIRLAAGGKGASQQSRTNCCLEVLGSGRCQASEQQHPCLHRLPMPACFPPPAAARPRCPVHCSAAAHSLLIGPLNRAPHAYPPSPPPTTTLCKLLPTKHSGRSCQCIC